MKTFLVDGNNLLKIGYHGVKDYHHKGKHVGGIWYFINTLRKFIEEYNFDKVIVMWDGIDSASTRKKIYPEYKMQRGENVNIYDDNSYLWQRERVKTYVEEMFIRQIEVDNIEADDLIAYYCLISQDEIKIIFSGDNDLTQLISDKVSIYSPNVKRVYKEGDKIKLYNYEIPHQNILTYKVITGDKSDNIDGIYYLGEKTFFKLFPELLDNVTKISDILKKAEQLLAEDKNNNTLKNLLSGRTKTGVYGNEFFEVNEKIVDLSKPMITEEGKEIVEQYYRENLDPEGRGYRNFMKLMMEDGLFKYLPKADDAWVNFLKPFMKLTRKEKKYLKN